MRNMQLDTELRSVAVKLFNEGKQPGFDAEALVLQFRQECQRRTNLYRMFLEIQIQAAWADGIMSPEEEQALLGIAAVLGFTDHTYRQLEMLVRFSMGMMGGGEAGEQASAGSANGANSGAGQRRASSGVERMSARDAHKALGVEPGDDKATVKRAYRRLMSQHHPDKLVARGLPEEMIELATDKTQHIQKAYEKIKQSRGW